MNKVSANCSKEDKIYPQTTAEITEAQQANATLQYLSKCNTVLEKGLEIILIKNATCVCKDGRLLIPKPFQVCALIWYHHCLQRLGHTGLKETMSTTMY
jgi:hypothetical protein